MNLEELCSWLSHQKGMMAQMYAKDLAKYIVRTKQQADRIAELEKEKIRAYDNGYEDGRKKNTQLNTQLHPLSDEEIMAMAKDYIHYTEYRLAIQFARAILKKASEK
jgi:hypothetical protein